MNGDPVAKVVKRLAKYGDTIIPQARVSCPLLDVLDRLNR
jgi:hypothetical protein